MGTFPLHSVEVPRCGIIKWQRIVTAHYVFVYEEENAAVQSSCLGSYKFERDYVV